MQVDQIAQRIFDEAGFETASFELKRQYHYLASLKPLIHRVGDQMAIIQMKEDVPATIFYKATAYSFTKDVYIYSGAETVSELLAKSSVESHTASDGSSIYLFNIK